MKMLYELFSTEIRKRCSNKQKLKAIKMLNFLFVESSIPFEIKQIKIKKRILNHLFVNNPLNKDVIVISGFTTPLHNHSSKAYLGGNANRQREISKQSLIFTMIISFFCLAFDVVLLLNFNKFVGLKKVLAIVLLVVTAFIGLFISNHVNSNNSSYDVALAMASIIMQENQKKCGLILLEDAFDISSLPSLIDEYPMLKNKKVIYIDNIEGKNLCMYANNYYLTKLDKLSKELEINRCEFVEKSIFYEFNNLLYVSCGEYIENKQVMFKYAGTNNDTFINTEFYDNVINKIEEIL